MNEGIVKVMMTYLSNRWRVNIKFSDFIKNFFTKLFCNCCKNTETESQMNLFAKGEAKIRKELDCINLLTRLRKLNTLISLLLTKE